MSTSFHRDVDVHRWDSFRAHRRCECEQVPVGVIRFLLGWTGSCGCEQVPVGSRNLLSAEQHRGRQQTCSLEQGHQVNQDLELCLNRNHINHHLCVNDGNLKDFFMVK